jgi:hypothetical protein
MGAVQGIDAMMLLGLLKGLLIEATRGCRLVVQEACCSRGPEFSSKDRGKVKS